MTHLDLVLFFPLPLAWLVMLNDIRQTIYRLHKSISRFQSATPHIENSMSVNKLCLCFLWSRPPLPPHAYSCLLMLSFTKIFLVVAEMVCQFGHTTEFGIPNHSTISFIAVCGHKCTKFATLIKCPRDYLPWKFGGGCSSKFLDNSKNLQILSHREFRCISELENRSQQLLRVSVWNLAEI